MIIGLRNKKPVITFGLGKKHLTVSIGTPVDVWLDTIYKSDVYAVSITTSLPKIKISNQQFRVTPSATGSFKIIVKVATADKKINLKSNTITLIVE